MKKCTCDTIEDIVNCNGACDADTKPEARHPSEITLEEFIKVAEIMNEKPSPDWMEWEIEHYEEHLKLRTYAYWFVISFAHFESAGLCVTKFTKSHGVWSAPTFQQSLNIAAYLDQIGIEYRPKEDK